jgi:hypothetical protein
MTITTIQGNSNRISDARNAAIARIREELKPACGALARLGLDTKDNRILARKISGLPAADMSGWVSLGAVGVDATWTTQVDEAVKTPAELDAAMADARKLVRMVTDGVNAYMAGHDAETAETVKQLDASAR